jgi:hypothetical protein
VTYVLAPEAAAALADAASFCAQQINASVAEDFLANFELKVLHRQGRGRQTA